MSYELILMNASSFLTGKEVISQSLVTGVFLFGMGIGSYHFAKVKGSQVYSRFCSLELMTSFCALFSPFFILIILFLFKSFGFIDDLNADKYNFAAELFPFLFISLILGFFTGGELPLLLKVFTKKNVTPVLLFMNYVGALVAGLILFYFLNQGYDLFKLFFFFSGLNLFLWILFVYKIEKRKAKIYFFLSIIGVISNLYLGSWYPRLEMMYTKSDYFSFRMERVWDFDFEKTERFLDNYGSVQRLRTPYQNLDGVYMRSHKSLKNTLDELYTVYLNGKPQFNSANYKIYHETMAHGSINLYGKIPQRVLILGGGDGLLASELLKYDEIEVIDLIELDQKMVDFSKTNRVVANLNKGSLYDERVNIVIDDAFRYVTQVASKKYDCVFVDFPFPASNDLKRLYSFEFYKLLKNVIHKSSIIVVDIPLFRNVKKGTLHQAGLSIIETMRFSGYENIFAFGPNSPFVLLSLEDRRFKFDYNKTSFIGDQSFSNLVEIKLPKKAPNAKVNSIFRPIDFMGVK